MKHVCVAARDVRVGDQLYNSLAAKQKQHPAFYWATVLRTETQPDGSIELHASGWYTVLHPREGVTIRRSESHYAT